MLQIFKIINKTNKLIVGLNPGELILHWKMQIKQKERQTLMHLCFYYHIPACHHSPWLPIDVLHVTKESVRQHYPKKNGSIRHGSSVFYQELCAARSQGNNKFGKWNNPITKTEFTLAIFPSAFYQQEKVNFNCFMISGGKKKKGGTMIDFFSDVTCQDGDSSVCCAHWKLFNGGALADGYTISSRGLNVPYRE